MKYVLALLATAAALVAVGPATAATTYKVFLGEQAEVPGGFKKLPATLNQFMPSRLVVAAGDSVTFSSATFHTVTYTPKPLPLLVPDPTKAKYTGILDAAGQAFYFDGMPKLIYNPQAFGPFGPKTIAGTPASSGILSPRGPKAPPATMTYTFPKTGTFKLYCTLHPGMNASVVVKPAGAAVPRTPAQVESAGLAAQNAAWEKAKAIQARVETGADTVAMGVGGKISLLGFYPKALTVKAGSTVTFANRSPSEVHNVVFSPPKYAQQFGRKTDLLPPGPKAPNQVTPILPYGSDPKPYTYEGKTAHGNGFFSTEPTAGRLSAEP